MAKNKIKKNIKFLEQHKDNPIFKDMVEKETKRLTRIYNKHRSKGNN